MPYRLGILPRVRPRRFRVTPLPATTPHAFQLRSTLIGFTATATRDVSKPLCRCRRRLRQQRPPVERRCPTLAVENHPYRVTTSRPAFVPASLLPSLSRQLPILLSNCLRCRRLHTLSRRPSDVSSDFKALIGTPLPQRSFNRVHLKGIPALERAFTCQQILETPIRPLPSEESFDLVVTRGQFVYDKAQRETSPRIGLILMRYRKIAIRRFEVVRTIFVRRVVKIRSPIDLPVSSET
jgi:hypothetical protein